MAHRQRHVTEIERLRESVRLTETKRFSETQRDREADTHIDKERHTRTERPRVTQRGFSFLAIFQQYHDPGDLKWASYIVPMRGLRNERTL